MKWLKISILAVLVAGPSRQFAIAQTKTVSEVPLRSITSVNGAEVYKEYCAVCHGTEGRGDGPAAVALKQTLTDLTKLAQKNGGKFPALAIQQSITSPDSIPAHGTASMPIWGQLLVTAPDNAAAGALRIHNLTKYIEGLQK